MRHRSVFLLRLGATLGLLSLVLLVALDVWRQTGRSKAASGVAAPGFRLHKLGGRGSLALSQLTGHVVVLNFFASWCDPCRGEAPLLRRLSEGYRRYAVVVGIATNDDLGDARAFAHKYDLAYPLLVADEEILSTYGVRGLPETVFISATGSISGRPIVGPLTDKLASRRIDQALEEAQ
jgi:cytochrome c biogenesis protein CcmG/thiol:disulfide interchange protein DsbE